MLPHGQLHESVHLEEMEVAADLDGSVAGVAHFQGDGSAVGVILDVAFGKDDSAYGYRCRRFKSRGLGICYIRLTLENSVRSRVSVISHDDKIFLRCYTCYLIGLWIDTSLDPSVNTASTCRSPIISATPSIT